MADEKIGEIYNELLKEYGEQVWWPVYINGNFVYSKDSKNKELSSRQRFIISISAILTQNTSWKNVMKAIKNLDKFNFLTKEAIKQLKEEELGILIKTSGYYKQKAKKLKNFIGFLDSKKEVNRENLLEIWGIGKETADSILLYAYNKEVFMIDAYSIRAMERVLGEKFNYDSLQKIFLDNLEKDYTIYNEFHALLVKHAKDICIKKEPKCLNCCLRKNCKYFTSLA